MRAKTHVSYVYRGPWRRCRQASCTGRRAASSTYGTERVSQKEAHGCARVVVALTDTVSVARPWRARYRVRPPSKPVGLCVMFWNTRVSCQRLSRAGAVPTGTRVYCGLVLRSDGLLESTLPTTLRNRVSLDRRGVWTDVFLPWRLHRQILSASLPNVDLKSGANVSQVLGYTHGWSMGCVAGLDVGRPASSLTGA